MTATISPAATRIEWPAPCPVRFGWDSKNRRTVRFGPGVFGTHDVTVNGVAASLGSWRWTEHDRVWRFTEGRLRRLGTIDYLSSAAHRKVRVTLEEQVSGLAESHASAFDDARRGHADEHAGMAEQRAVRLLAAARAQQDRADVSRAVADGAALLRPCEPRRCVIDPGIAEHPGECWVHASIEHVDGRIGWAVSAARSRHSSELFYLPEHLVKERNGQR